jgi:carbamoyltransferase
MENKNVTPSDVAKLIADKNIVALFQGRSEAGHRALGNRSILYDPRDPNGKDHVNIVKQREWYRPFAASVMLEHVHDWFDMAGLKESVL